jgi:hypothetical protein
MRGRILLLVGLGVGYVLGARAGREKYDQIARSASRFWHDPRVQKQVDSVEGFVKDKAPQVKDFVQDNAKKATDKVSETVQSKTRTTGSSSTTSKSADASI